jgi:hypothetical protein
MFIMGLGLITSCDSSKENSDATSMNQAKRDINQIQKEVRLGNTDSYDELQIIYMDYPRENFLFWAMLMANKYNYPRAHLDLFYCTIESYGLEINEFNQMDTLTQKFALEHLTIAVEKRVKGAKDLLSEIQKNR